MKKFMTLVLLFTSVAGYAAKEKTIVDDAKKLKGNLEKLDQARSIIAEAVATEPTASDPNTYFVAGDIEFAAYDKSKTKQQINPSSPEAQGTLMADQLLNGFKYYMKALELAQNLPAKEGEKMNKDITKQLQSHAEDFFNAGASYFEAKKYYPEAYEAFFDYGELANNPYVSITVNPEQVPISYFNAGLSAYSGNNVDAAAEAFKKARLSGYDEPTSYTYEIACWQNIGQTNPDRAEESQQKVAEVAEAGFNKFGLEQTLFFNNLINCMVLDNKMDAAIEKLNATIQENPEKADLYGLLGYVYDRAGRENDSELAYRKAVATNGVDFDTLKNAAKQLYRIGANKLNDLQGAEPETNAARNQIKTDYFEKAMEIVNMAGEMNPNDSDLLNLQENINYALETFFN